MKVLLIGAGRRFSFIQNLINLGHDISSLELSTKVPISDLCHVYTGYDHNISGLCQMHQPDIILPLQDFWCYKLSETNIKPAICSKSKSASICYNKNLLAEFMEDNFPCYYPSPEQNQPVICKPINGNSSKGIKKFPKFLNTLDSDSYIQQKFIDGKEYSVDAYFDKHGLFFDGVVRSRDRIAGGEVVDSTIITGSLARCLLEATQIIGNKMCGLRGPKCFQYMYDNTPWLLEINDRFGGGSTLSHKAGFNMIRLIEKEYKNNEELTIDDHTKIKPLKMQRVFHDTFISAE